MSGFSVRKRRQIRELLPSLLYLCFLLLTTLLWTRFGNFFNHIDSFRHNTFLYVTSGGIPASKDEQATKDTSEADKAALAEVESEAEDEVVNGGEEGG